MDPCQNIKTLANQGPAYLLYVPIKPQPTSPHIRTSAINTTNQNPGWDGPHQLAYLQQNNWG